MTTKKVSYHWHLRELMATRGMFTTSDLVPLLAGRGVVLSREQVYRLVAQTPERLNLVTLAALCDILDCTAADLIEIVQAAKPSRRPSPAKLTELRPRRARVAPSE